MARRLRTEIGVPPELAAFDPVDWGPGDPGVDRWKAACIEYLNANPDKVLPFGEGDILGVAPGRMKGWEAAVGADVVSIIDRISSWRSGCLTNLSGGACSPQAVRPVVGPGLTKGQVPIAAWVPSVDGVPARWSSNGRTGSAGCPGLDGRWVTKLGWGVVPSPDDPASSR